jgi:Fur family peroxide stress response transcriptional regulator
MAGRQNTTALIAHLESAGKRSTPQRHAVCAALVDHGGHPTVAEVFEQVRNRFPMISQATVYNTVETLCDLGLLIPLDLTNDEHTHYDLNLDPHINVVCTGCGQITDVQASSLDLLFEQVGQSSGYAITRSNSVVLYGVCSVCHVSRRSVA